MRQIVSRVLGRWPTSAVKAKGESLVERLGLDRNVRAIIINCDDVGSSHSANLASLSAMEQGIATSATLMTPCPFAREAVDLFAGKDMGVHLTLNAEYPSCCWRPLTGAASISTDDGRLLASPAEVLARGRLEDVRAECRAQIDQALDWGVDVTHIDSHMFTLQDQRFVEIYLDLGAEYRLPVRMAEELRGPASLGSVSRRLADERGVLHNDDFIFRWGQSTARLLRRRAPWLRPGVTEFILHPALDGPELRAYDPETAQVRADDYACAMSAELAELIASRRLRPMSYRPLRDLQRGETAMA